MSNPQAIGYITPDNRLRAFYIHWGLDRALYEPGFLEALTERIDEQGDIVDYVEYGIESGGYSSSEELLNDHPYSDGECLINEDLGNSPYIGCIWILEDLEDWQRAEIAEQDEEDLAYYMEDYHIQGVLDDRILIKAFDLDHKIQGEDLVDWIANS